jgi:SAM-dependent methyltransferase
LRPQSGVNFTDKLKDMTPAAARRLSRRVKAAVRNWRNRDLTAQQVFTQVYAEKMWGEGQDQFYSGPGSNEEAAKPYADFVTHFIAENKIQSVVDLGCGDFRVGRMIATACAQYTGVDVVEPLIVDNNRRFGCETISFRCLDITTDELPDADLVLIREVFQHISNAQIVATLTRLKKYKFALFTDVQPVSLSGYAVNKDKVHGASSRLTHQSCLQLERPPFNVRDIRLVFETASPYFASYAPFGSAFKLRTFLWSPAATAHR